MERRIFSTGEIRATASGTKRTLVGYASVKDTVALIGGSGRGGFHEVIRGANVFGDAIKKSDVRFLVNHDPNNLLARTGAGLTLTETSRGLRYQVELPSTSLAADIFELVRTGAMRDNSFSFSLAPGDDSFDEYDCCTGDNDCCGAKGSVLRTISRVDKLYDASLVVFPAYQGTSVAGMLVEDLSADPSDPSDEDDDENGDGEGGRSLVLIPAEVRARARRAHRRTAAKEATDFAANLFRAQVRATRTLVGGQ